MVLSTLHGESNKLFIAHTDACICTVNHRYGRLNHHKILSFRMYNFDPVKEEERKRQSQVCKWPWNISSETMYFGFARHRLI